MYNILEVKLLYKQVTFLKWNLTVFDKHKNVSLG